MEMHHLSMLGKLARDNDDDDDDDDDNDDKDENDYDNDDDDKLAMILTLIKKYLGKDIESFRQWIRSSNLNGDDRHHENSHQEMEQNCWSSTTHEMKTDPSQDVAGNLIDKGRN